MAVTLTYTISLGAGNVGLVASPGLEAVLKDTAGSAQPAVTSGFVDLGNGNYSWTGSIDENYRGSVSFRKVGDTAILAVAPINPESGAMISEIYDEVTGPHGAVLVDHDYGGNDRLAYKTAGGVGVANAEIRIYLTADYNAGLRSNSYIVARETTKAGGEWTAPLALDDGAYTGVFFASGRYGPNTKVFTVSDPATVPAAGWVIATPVSTSSSSSGVTCDEFGTVTPSTHTVLGCPMYGQMPSIEMMQGEQRTIRWYVRDSSGNAVDLSTCGDFPDPPDEEGEDPSRVVLRIKESLWANIAYSSDTAIDVEGVVVDPVGGVVDFELPALATDVAGIYKSSIAIYNSSNEIQLIQQTWLVINPSPFGSATTVHPTALSIPEIRLHMRDADSSANELLNQVQFSAAEIAHCIALPIQYWNESQPPVPSHQYSTTGFPFRYHWLQGTIAQLYRIAAHWYRRNKLSYTAGGITVDDLNKDREYQQMADQLWAEYTEFVKNKKTQLNGEQVYGAFGSAYSWYRRY